MLNLKTTWGLKTDGFFLFVLNFLFSFNIPILYLNVSVSIFSFSFFFHVDLDREFFKRKAIKLSLLTLWPFYRTSHSRIMISCHWIKHLKFQAHNIWIYSGIYHIPSVRRLTVGQPRNYFCRKRSRSLAFAMRSIQKYRCIIRTGKDDGWGLIDAECPVQLFDERIKYSHFE